ncbi:hypothetical protein EKO27_g9701 [Xylaria grammica]|uniref:EngB-type G domain-containing protein n=1 Tax=Xylaria grammica TaxID=363999 RepID=A0A439CTD5_9PEZI|nr:hypothetical protein EKO27_g9701 [Xylaria grammica]
MPTALRPVLLGAFASSRLRWVQTRLFCVSTATCKSVKYPNVAAFLIPEFRTSEITELTADDLFKTSSLSSAPGQPLEEGLTKLYIQHPADFVYAESNFYKLRKNSRVPEVCILGRSNVGKSSLVNALANRPSNRLAYVSKKTGKTRSINTYGFGPAPTIQELQTQGSGYKDEDIPTHTFHLVDMPGYGHASLEEWGRNIALYLNKRKAVKGAIVLVDAEVGPKDSDFRLLQLLSDAQLKTAIVLTKADKVKNGLIGLRETCAKVWKGIHAIESRTTEGNWVWERDVYVTAVGAKDSAVVKSTLTTARLAVARLAGLVKDEKPNVERNKRWSGKMISFDDLQYAPSKSSVTETNGDANEKLTQPVWDTPSPSKSTPGLPKVTSTFADLDYATKAQHSGRARNGASWGSWEKGRRAHVRAFHSSPALGDNQSPHKLTAAELKDVIDDFVKSLKANTPRDRVRRLQQQRERQPPKLFKTSFKKLEERQAHRLRLKFPEQTDRARAVFQQRLKIEEHRSQTTATREAIPRSEWPTIDDVRHQKDSNWAIPTSEFEAAFTASSGLEDSKKKNKNITKDSE